MFINPGLPNVLVFGGNVGLGASGCDEVGTIGADLTGDCIGGSGSGRCVCDCMGRSGSGRCAGDCMGDIIAVGLTGEGAELDTFGGREGGGGEGSLGFCRGQTLQYCTAAWNTTINKDTYLH